jgi:transposase
MISFNRRTSIYVAKGPTDMRASYDALFARAKTVLEKDPYSGHLFVFLNSKRSCCKCLYYDGTGLVLICKRLEKGLFAKVNPFLKGDIVLTQAEFSLFFEGADITKRFIESPKEVVKAKKTPQAEQHTSH